MQSAAHEDPVVSKYVATGLPRDAVQLGVATFGDVQNKVSVACPNRSRGKGQKETAAYEAGKVEEWIPQR